MNLKRRINMSESLISQELNDELMLYKTDSEEIHVLNQTARMIYNLHNQGKTVDEMIPILQQTFQLNDIQTLKKDIDACLAQLKTKKLL